MVGEQEGGVTEGHIRKVLESGRRKSGGWRSQSPQRIAMGLKYGLQGEEGVFPEADEGELSQQVSDIAERLTEEGSFVATGKKGDLSSRSFRPSSEGS